MDAYQLAESTLLPTDDRVLIQYTIESAKKELERMTYYESNKAELLKGIKIDRSDLIG